MFVTDAVKTPIFVRTGMWEVVKLGLKHSLLDQHRQYATWLMWLSLMSLPILWFLEKKVNKILRIIFIFILVGSSVLVSLAADKGGRMVYEYRVGVEK